MPPTEERVYTGPHSTLITSRSRLLIQFSTVRDANNILVVLDTFSQNLPDNGIMQNGDLVPNIHVARPVLRPIRIDLDLECRITRFPLPACIYDPTHPSPPSPSGITNTDLVR